MSTDIHNQQLSDISQLLELEQHKVISPQKRMSKVSQVANHQQGVHDIIAQFMGWAWVLFAGIGLNIYEASKKNSPATASSITEQPPKPTNEKGSDHE